MIFQKLLTTASVETFKTENEFTGSIVSGQITKDIQIALPLKYMNNFMRAYIFFFQQLIN